MDEYYSSAFIDRNAPILYGSVSYPFHSPYIKKRGGAMKKYHRGFTFIELLIVLAIIFLFVGIGWFFVLKTICQGNFWFQTGGALRELRVSHPNVEKVLVTQRNVFDQSVFLVENKDGTRKEYCLDTSILFNYDFSDCEVKKK